MLNKSNSLLDSALPIAATLPLILTRPEICIQHDGSGTGEFEKNSTPWENLDELEINKADLKIDKYAYDVFYASTLQTQLKELEVTELFITGCATDFCVEATVQSALTKDYNITIVGDAHTTGERPHLKAAQIIEHYNWVWQHMIPTKGQIKVEPTHLIMATLGYK
ncbi:cysteine hydrolase family protein [Cellulophaga baltica]|uniref:Nicotinamidase-related amidase n=1 Tax=Cellulophaga baltica TaxID=76594 RepID=A0A1G7LQP6_9FLAO|nr:isochorismatase family protein [Cellulophaga baltica]SDF51721.1 Nicotinamidase-related amidase [Cellulophaga baltica]